jgi:hypothetical protein
MTASCSSSVSSHVSTGQGAAISVVRCQLSCSVRSAATEVQCSNVRAEQRWDYPSHPAQAHGQ